MDWRLKQPETAYRFFRRAHAIACISGCTACGAESSSLTSICSVGMAGHGGGASTLGLTGLHSSQLVSSHPLQCPGAGLCTSNAFLLASLATRRARRPDVAPLLVPVGARSRGKGSREEAGGDRRSRSPVFLAWTTFLPMLRTGSAGVKIPESSSEAWEIDVRPGSMLRAPGRKMRWWCRRCCCCCRGEDSRTGGGAASSDDRDKGREGW